MLLLTIVGIDENWILQQTKFSDGIFSYKYKQTPFDNIYPCIFLGLFRLLSGFVAARLWRELHDPTRTFDTCRTPAFYCFVAFLALRYRPRSFCCIPDLIDLSVSVDMACTPADAQDCEICEDVQGLQDCNGLRVAKLTAAIPRPEICPELCDAWHAEFPDGEDGQQSHDPVRSCIEGCVHITGRDNNPRDRYALVFDDVDDHSLPGNGVGSGECNNVLTRRIAETHATAKMATVPVKRDCGIEPSKTRCIGMPYCRLRGDSDLHMYILCCATLFPSKPYLVVDAVPRVTDDARYHKVSSNLNLSHGVHDCLSLCQCREIPILEYMCKGFGKKADLVRPEQSLATPMAFPDLDDRRGDDFLSIVDASDVGMKSVNRSFEDRLKLKKYTNLLQRMRFPQRRSIEGYLNGQTSNSRTRLCILSAFFGTRGGERGALLVTTIPESHLRELEVCSFQVLRTVTISRSTFSCGDVSPSMVME
ncbi:hypothetical protein KCU92_g147, partial [Aureobasidium melanogenum]